MSENLLELVPERIAQWVEEDGRIVLLKPKVKSARVRKFMVRPNYRVKLDDYGSWVWKNIDDARSVEEIGGILRDKYGESIEPLYERLGDFLSILEENGLIRLKK